MKTRIMLNGKELQNSIIMVDSLNNTIKLDTEEGIHTKLNPHTSYVEVSIFGNEDSILER